MLKNTQSIRRSAFTIIELVVVILIIAVLFAILSPAISRRVPNAPERMHSLDNLKQLGLACHSYHDAHGHFPPMIGRDSYSETKNAFGTVFFHLLPYLEQRPLYENSWDPNANQHDVRTNGVAGKSVSVFVNPADPTISGTEVVDGEALSCYAANMQVFGKTRETKHGSIEPESWQVYANISESFGDGTSNTILMAEKYAQCGTGGTRWGHTKSNRFVPTFAAYSRQTFQSRPDPDTECNPHLASGPWSGGRRLHVVMGGGSVRAWAEDVGAGTWWAVCTPNGGDKLGSDWD